MNGVDTLTEVTPLMYALCYEKEDVVKSFINGSEINQADLEKRCNLPGVSDDISPLECANESKNKKVNIINYRSYYKKLKKQECRQRT